MLLKQRMKQLLEDLLHTLNQLPNRKVNGKDFTTYDLAKRIEEKLDVLKLVLTFDDLVNILKQDNNLED